MAYSDGPGPFISHKAIPTPRLSGLISAMLTESGYDLETFYPATTLIQHIVNDSIDSITLELKKRPDGWKVYDFRAHQFTVGAHLTRQHSDS